MDGLLKGPGRGARSVRGPSDLHLQDVTQITTYTPGRQSKRPQRDETQNDYKVKQPWKKQIYLKGHKMTLKGHNNHTEVQSDYKDSQNNQEKTNTP